MSERWAILVHGGAKTIAPEEADAHRAGCLAATNAGRAILEAGGGAVDAVVAAIRTLEDDPTFNAGYGSVQNRDGDVECDAAIVDGATLDVGAVAALKGGRNPILAAHALLRTDTVLIAGDGALRFVRESGLETCRPDELIARPSAPGGCDTVGCVAMDVHGDLAAGTSTGGLEGVRPGRVGDSPLPGCGLAAENEVGAVSLSGDGESIIRLTLASRVMQSLATETPLASGRRALSHLPRVGGEAGCILLDARCEPAMVHNSQNFAVGYCSSGSAARAYLHQGEFEHG